MILVSTNKKKYIPVKNLAMYGNYYVLKKEERKQDKANNLLNNLFLLNLI